VHDPKVNHQTQLPATNIDEKRPWYRELNGYHWFVFTVAALGWLLDCFDQQLFVLSRQSAMRELLGTTDKGAVASAVGTSTSIFMVGWATGGLIFGVLGDRWGRARTMLVTVLLYSVCTGLSGLSRGVWDFNLFRFLTGLGVGGEFAVGVALVAETMPDRARPYVLSLLQALSAVGNIAAALTQTVLAQFVEAGTLTSTWRPMFFIGALPAVLCLLIRWKLKEPERWQSISTTESAERQLGSYRALFSSPELRHNALVGLALACVGVIGLWAIVFFATELVGEVFPKHFASEGLAEDQIPGRVDRWKGINSLMLNAGAFFGMFGFGYLAQAVGRRPAFAIAMVAAAISTAAVFWLLERPAQVFVLTPLMGFCMLSLFAGYALYLPELFPTHLRSTGTSFCYNVGRFLAATGPVLLGLLTSRVFKDTAEPLRYAGITMCSIFLIGLLILPFAPETRGKPLPD
jgi:MFS family permease